MTSLDDTFAFPPPRWGDLFQAFGVSLRSLVLANPSALVEACRERVGHPVDPDHRPHLLAALAWLERAQDEAGGSGFARGYSMTWNPYFRSRGWQPPYPETTGYIIPTLYLAARHLSRADLKRRAERAAHWEIQIALPDGAVRGGVLGESESPVVFNTGQVLLGWLAALDASACYRFEDAAVRAGRYLVTCLDTDGMWRRGTSHLAHERATLYNTRTSWALAEAGTRLGIPSFRWAAIRNLRAVARRQHADGWIPDCCLTDPARPLLHTVAYGIRGLLEGGRVLEDTGLIAQAAQAAGRIAESQGADGRLPGRFAVGWRPAASWSCLTGEAQMANIWLRLSEITGERRWRTHAAAALRWIKSTQNRSSDNPGLQGGIKGSFPCSGPYGRYQTLSWAAKFFVDALIRSERLSAAACEPDAAAVLA
jgi:hypothetical protein